ncbi:MAG: hypothetical protein M3268_06685, partial [Acidobacteriota bacterium]|nr:hypothetical protein [Acidobacteriota bacterium]
PASTSAMLPVVVTEDVPPPAAKKSATEAPAAPAPQANAQAAASNAKQSQTNATPQQADATQPQTSTLAVAAAGPAQLILMSGQREMRVGERQRLMVFVKADAPLSLVAATLKFDPRVFAVRSVEKGSLFDGANAALPQLTQSVDPRGSLLALVAPATGSPVSGAGVLLFVEIEALSAGDSEIGFDQSGLHLMSTDGRNVAAKATPVRVTVK